MLFDLINSEGSIKGKTRRAHRTDAELGGEYVDLEAYASRYVCHREWEFSPKWDEL